VVENVHLSRSDSFILYIILLLLCHNAVCESLTLLVGSRKRVECAYTPWRYFLILTQLRGVGPGLRKHYCPGGVIPPPDNVNYN
jgi:hypothetical protein